MKQITIYDLIPLLKKGWVAMDADGRWFWHNRKPILYQGSWHPVSEKVCLCECFDIVFFDGIWEDSLIKCGESAIIKKHKEEKELKTLMKDPRYWKHQDPEIVKRVEEGFKRLYG